MKGILLHRAEECRRQQVRLPLRRRRQRCRRRRRRRGGGPEYRVLPTEYRHRAEVGGRRDVVSRRRGPPQFRDRRGAGSLVGATGSDETGRFRFRFFRLWLRLSGVDESHDVGD